MHTALSGEPRASAPARPPGGALSGAQWLAALVGLVLASLLVLQLADIGVYRHDAMYYLPRPAFFDKLLTEGRWLNYLLFPVLRLIPGPAAAIAALLCWGLFVFISARRWVGSPAYALLLACLALQVTPLMNQLQWPATSLPAFALLALAALLAPRLPAGLFYPLFAVLLFGSFSHLYYLLPLLHLHWLAGKDLTANLKTLWLKLIPLWAMGFVVGYGSALLAVYLAGGGLGIAIEEWRRPHYIESGADLLDNSQRALHYLAQHLQPLLGKLWLVPLATGAVILSLMGNRVARFVPLALLALCMGGVHYLLTVPLGIVISFRTAGPLWLACLVVMFFTPLRNRYQAALLLACALALGTALYLQNRQALKWYNTITSTLQQALLDTLPKPAGDYTGVVLLSDDAAVAAAVERIERHHRLAPGQMESLSRAARWVPAAKAAGFNKVWLCGSQDRRQRPVCARILTGVEPRAPACRPGLYDIVGESRGFLLVAINPPECLAMLAE
ncbi:hypothetical protein [Parahaliea mediterranea]|uniref:hypothetical protein n=1 Tax=Parahaliea mediterranea TaxID=651086 RepID=UPI001300A963|nr:hypothetical protein [Parahaliea mediterranea]